MGDTGGRNVLKVHTNLIKNEKKLRRRPEGIRAGNAGGGLEKGMG